MVHFFHVSGSSSTCARESFPSWMWLSQLDSDPFLGHMVGLVRMEMLEGRSLWCTKRLRCQELHVADTGEDVKVSAP